MSMTERSSSSVHYSLLIACVLVAFVCGAFLSVLMVSCYCGQQGQQDQACEAQTKLSLAKLSSLMEPQDHGVPEQIYCSFLSKQHGAAITHTAPSGGGLDYQVVSPSNHHSACLSPSNHHSASLSPSNHHSASLSTSNHHSASLYPSNHHSASLSPSNHHSASMSPSNHHSASQSPSSKSPTSVTPVLSNHQSDAAVPSEDLEHIHREVDRTAEGDGVATVILVLGPGATASCGAQAEVASFYTSSTLPQDHRFPAVQIGLVPQLELETGRKRDAEVKQRLNCPVQCPSQPLSLIKLDNRAPVSRQHNFNQQRGLQHRLVHMSPSRNCSSKDNRQQNSGFDCSNKLDRLDCGDEADEFGNRSLLPGSSCLTRQHSYTEQPHTHAHTHRAAIIRRTASLKPHTHHNRGMFLPATAPFSTHTTFNY